MRSDQKHIPAETVSTDLPSALSLYIAEVKDIPKLTKEQETALVIRLRNGDDTAREELITHNLMLVIIIARHYANTTNELSDLIQEGNIGLIEAARDFVNKIGYSFKSYADDSIHHQILDALRGRPKIKTVSISYQPVRNEDGETNLSLEELVPDMNAIDPAMSAEINENNHEMAQIIATLPTQNAMTKIATGYTTYELGKAMRKEYNESLRVLSHPSRLSLFTEPNLG